MKAYLARNNMKLAIVLMVMILLLTSAAAKGGGRGGGRGGVKWWRPCSQWQPCRIGNYFEESVPYSQQSQKPYFTPQKQCICLG
uniref:Bifunctional inhibitor/plant lipid transfer protein/seed storage helical domain-containing protein n=1 Tax=Fagus sylvatica TaxID=28930 RepID=A0A2N9GID6_FAGSY